MKFSVIFELQCADPSPAGEAAALHDCVAQAIEAERQGFDAVWAVEHHSLKWYAHMSAPEIFLTWVAARTERIRLGHGVVCMPFGYNHPLRVAERAAMLDLLSDGRLDLGAGRGATRMEMSGFGVTKEETQPQVEEALRILARCWRDDPFEWHGLVDIEPRTVVPRPAQLPHPPLFLACTKDETVELAADLGVGALVLGFGGPDQVRQLAALYREAGGRRDGSRLVSDCTNDHLAALCPTIVLDDGEAAFQIGARGQKFFAESIQHWNLGTPEPVVLEVGVDVRDAVEHARSELEATMVEGGHPIPVIAASTGPFNIDHAYGTPDDATAYVERLVEAGADEIMCIMQMGGVPHEAAMETLRHYGETIIPRFRPPGEGRP